MRYDRIIIAIFILCSLSFPSQFKAHTQELTTKRVNHIGKSYLTYVEPKNVLKTDIDIIKHLSKEYGVDYKLIMAISIHETGHWTSYNYLTNKNVGGMFKNGSIMKFDNYYDSYEYMIRNLKYNYIDKGLITIEQIGSKYCPLGAGNDPNNLNRYWVPTVKKLYEEME